LGSCPRGSPLVPLSFAIIVMMTSRRWTLRWIRQVSPSLKGDFVKLLLGHCLENLSVCNCGDVRRPAFAKLSDASGQVGDVSSLGERRTSRLRAPIGWSNNDTVKRAFRRSGSSRGRLKLPTSRFLQLAAGTVSLCHPSSALGLGATYRARPVRMIVAFPAGNASDRHRAPDGAIPVAAASGSSFFVENRPGAGGKSWHPKLS